VYCFEEYKTKALKSDADKKEKEKSYFEQSRKCQTMQHQNLLPHLPKNVID
jgi:hypothetical protein